MAETPIEWYRRMKAEAAPFEAAEKQFLSAARETATLGLRPAPYWSQRRVPSAGG
jgi:hypothetical protein